MASQAVVVSFELKITIRSAGRDLHKESFSIVDYMPAEAEFKTWEEAFLITLAGPIAAGHLSKTDKIAASAFFGTAEVLREKYKIALDSARSKAIATDR